MTAGAVLTADIVNFTLLPQNTTKKQLVTRLSTVLKNYKFEFYRGDSFQAYIRMPVEALRLVLQLRTSAKSFSMIQDIRVGIGIGQVDKPVRLLRTTNSEAFVLSGRSFDLLSEGQRLHIQSSSEEANAAFRVIAAYADFLIKRLTTKQAEVVCELLKGHTQDEVAKKLKKAQATINKHAQAASWTEIETLVSEYIKVIHQFKLS